MDDVAHRELDDLVALRPRDVGDLKHFRRDVPGSRVVADVLSDPCGQRVVQRHSVAQPDEQHDADVVVPVLTDHQAFDHFVQLLDLSVDLRGADAHAARIQHRVGPAVDDGAAVRSDLDVVAMAPHAGVAVVIRIAIAHVARIVPEADRHRRECARADELAANALSFRQRVAVVVERSHGHPEKLALDLPAPHRQQRIAADKARAEIGAARHRR